MLQARLASTALLLLATVGTLASAHVVRAQAPPEPTTDSATTDTTTKKKSRFGGLVQKAKTVAGNKAVQGAAKGVACTVVPGAAALNTPDFKSVSLKAWATYPGIARYLNDQSGIDPVKHGFLDHFASLQMLDDDSLQEIRSDAAVPHALRIDHHDRASSTNAEAGCLATLHPGGPEEQAFTLQKRCKQ